MKLQPVENSELKKDLYRQVGFRRGKLQSVLEEFINMDVDAVQILGDYKSSTTCFSSFRQAIKRYGFANYGFANIEVTMKKGDVYLIKKEMEMKR